MLRFRNITDLRLSIFILWIAFAVLLSILPFSQAMTPRGLSWDGALGATRALVGLWLPALSCFAALWFTDYKHHRASPESDPSPGHVVGALGLTILYISMCLLAVAVTLWSPVSVNPSDNSVIGPSFKERLSDTISWLQLLSPVLLAPLGYLTGHTIGRNTVG